MCIMSTTTWLGLVARVGRIRVGAPLGAVPLSTIRDQEGTLWTRWRPWNLFFLNVRGVSAY
jgi:hypothetical protein